MQMRCRCWREYSSNDIPGLTLPRCWEICRGSSLLRGWLRGAACPRWVSGASQQAALSTVCCLACAWDEGYLLGFFPKQGMLVARAAVNTPSACPGSSNQPVFSSGVKAVSYRPRNLSICSLISQSREKLSCCCFNFSKQIVTLKAVA